MRACDEWKMYREEDVAEKFIYDENDNIQRIDHYWNEVLSRKTAAGVLKFQVLKKVVTSTLSLFHGNADVERSLSINRKLLTAKRTLLSEEALNGLRITRDAVSQYDGDLLQVPITKSMIIAVKNSYRNYKRRLEEEKSELELMKKRKVDQSKETEKMLHEIKKTEERKRKVVQMEKDVKSNEQQLQAELTQANALFEEATSRFPAGNINKNFTEINIAQGLLEVAKKNINKSTAAVESCRQQRQEIDNKRKKLLESSMGAIKKITGNSDKIEKAI